MPTKLYTSPLCGRSKIYEKITLEYISKVDTGSLCTYTLPQERV